MALPPTSGARPVVLSIAGFDPSSGAGITADLKTIATHGFYGVCCITALTVQSTQGVCRVEPVTGEIVRQTLAELAGDMDIRAIRVGMLGSGKVALAVADFLDQMQPPNVVLDPIIRASSGADLLDHEGIEVLKTRLLKNALVVTPNVAEAAALTGAQVSDIGGMREAAIQLQAMGARNVVITGGHLAENTDLLRLESGEERQFSAPRVESQSTHGTGCAFASALACNLLMQKSLPDSVATAKEFVREAILAAYPVGGGVGPLNHLYSMKM